jgi:hypothetical protein
MQSEAQVFDAGVQPLRAVRAVAGLLPQVQDLQAMLPLTGAQGRIAGREEVELVKKGFRFRVLRA